MLWQIATTLTKKDLFPSSNEWTPSTHSHFNYSCKYLCHSPFYNFATLTASLFLVANLFFNPQGNTDALSWPLDTQKKVAEEAITILSWATQQPEGYHDPEVRISKTYPCAKWMELCMSFVEVVAVKWRHKHTCIVNLFHRIQKKKQLELW